MNAGIMSAISGLVLGRPYMSDEGMRMEWEKMMLDQCHEMTYPILANVDIVHTDPLLRVPLDSEADVFEVLETTVE